MHVDTHRNSISCQIQGIEELVSLPVESGTREELIQLIELLARELLAYRDLICDAATAARILGRKRSWIYDAVSRPASELQRRIAAMVAREKTSLVFRMSDLIRLRRELFEPDSKPVSERQLSVLLNGIATAERSGSTFARRSR